MEELERDGERLLLKDLSGSGGLLRPALAPEPHREIAIYRDVLQPLALDGPARVAAADESSAGWLVLELIEGTPLWQVGDLETWREAARWLARFHALPVPDNESLVQYDAAQLRARLELSPAAEPIARHVADRLASLPARLIHGDFYPANVLVEPGPRIRVVDWETCGIGPAVLDLAALVSGRWSDRERQRILEAYDAACASHLRPSANDVLYARLLLASQWVGWHDGWSAPPEQRHDWHDEFVELRERLGL
jgi:aminoglycoside phosphotransferase (APT) family kinase protein